MEPEKPAKPEIIAPIKESGGFKPKVLIIGLPIFIVQLAVVYFITANIILSNNLFQKDESDDSETTEVSADSDTSQLAVSEVIYSVEDMIVNPAGTNGKMLLLASLGLSVEKEETRKILEDKQVVVKDVIINVLSAKNVDQLSSSQYRDTIKTEIISRLGFQITGVKINNTYFSKFIIQ